MNWLISEIDRWNGVQERKRCFVRSIEIDPEFQDNENTAFILADYETGGPVLGEFLNTYRYFETADDARNYAVTHGYRCDIGDDE